MITKVTRKNYNRGTIMNDDIVISYKRIKEIILEEFDSILKEGWKKKKYKKSDYKKYNKLVKRGKSVMVQTAYGDEFAWEDGSSYGVFGSEEDGREIELDHDDIDIVMHEGGKGSGRPTKAGSKRDMEKRMDKAVSDANAKLDAAEKAMKKKKNEGRYRLSPQRDLEIHSGGSIAQVFGKNAVVALDKKSMRELVKLIRMNMGLFEKLERVMEGKTVRLSNGVKVEFLGKMKLQLTNYKGKKVVLDVGELRMFLKGAKKDMGVRA